MSTKDLTADELELTLALLADRKSRSQNLAANSGSRTTRHARTTELTIIESIATKLGGWPPPKAAKVEVTGLRLEKVPHDDTSDLEDGKY